MAALTVLAPLRKGWRKLFSINADAKTRKGRAAGWLTGIMYFAPSDISGRNVCAMASKGCKMLCLGWFAGRVTFTTAIKKARIAKTLLWFNEPEYFKHSLHQSTAALVRKGERESLKPCVRLNGSSDIAWELKCPELFAAFPDVQFYDYTKLPGRYDLPPNYHLTYSLSEDNEGQAFYTLEQGRNVAVVFRDEVPKVWRGIPVINGDADDLRFLDQAPEGWNDGLIEPRGCWVGLKAKGTKARQDCSGFVVDLRPEHLDGPVYEIW